MPVTTLDPNTGLIVIDLQKGIVGFPTVDPIAGVISNAAALAAAFRARQLPVILVNVTGGAPGRAEQNLKMGQVPPDFAEIIPELNHASGDILITKQTWGAFTNTDLLAELKAKEVTQVVVIGVATGMGVESTARQAHEFGFNVTLATDAMTDMNPQVQANSFTNIFPRLGETGTTQEIIAILGSSL